jgi:hypothetical protein
MPAPLSGRSAAAADLGARESVERAEAKNGDGGHDRQHDQRDLEPAAETRPCRRRGGLPRFKARVAMATPMLIES